MRALITGCAGFIGSSLVYQLLERGNDVIGVDNLSTGTEQAMSKFRKHPYFKFIQGDLLKEETCALSMINKPNVVFHLAANADVRFGLEHPLKDITQNIIATSNLLEAMRESGCNKIVFTSTGSVYGNADTPTPETAPFPVQTSLYATSKIAAEGLISSYCEGLGFSGVVLRLVSVLGYGYSHGHVIDFYRQLQEHPGHLDVLGDGQQRKSYMDVEDCVKGIILAASLMEGDPFKVFNLGTDETITVSESIDLIMKWRGADETDINYAGGQQGWAGDNPLIWLDCSKIRSVGWEPYHTIQQAVRNTIYYLDKTLP